MKLGPIQEKWVKSLEKNQDRQTTGQLGFKCELKDDGTYYACCLGEGGLIAGVCSWDPKGNLVVKDNNTGKPLKHMNMTLENYSYKALGLHDGSGGLRKRVEIFVGETQKTFSRLSDMNDSGVSWRQIAQFIRQNPTLVFTHPV